jgi:hypothetical protein
MRGGEDMEPRIIGIPTKELMDKLAEIYKAKGAKVVEIEGDIMAYFPSGNVVHVFLNPDVELEDVKGFLMSEALNGIH